ncbi:hydroxyacid dehydrogenase [Streptacidiphilus sp. MAP12-20]|uniref:hydroxyacid dehydrogenase n=1 Tax=Streptacidiphilus sp. MAP12-20 TaxID=3156299 RepID=UPI0035154922
MSQQPGVVIAMQPEVAARALTPDLLDRIAAVGQVDRGLIVTDFADPNSAAALAGAEVLLTGWGCPRIDAQVLAAAPRLRAVLHAAGTVKDHVAPEVWERGIAVSSAAQANAWPVAQYTLAAILLAGKRAFRHAACGVGGGTGFSNLDPALGNHARTVGVVGASRIGRLVVPLLAAHGYRIQVSDPTLTPAAAAALLPAGSPSAHLVDLDTLLASSDIVTLHAPLLPDTRYLIDARRLGLLRDGAVLINTARGALVDTDALTRHCGAGRIDAVLDVTDPEPLPATHPLRHLPGVWITPHLAGAAGTEVRTLGEFAVHELERLAAGLPLLGQVTAHNLAHLA